jgi:acyl carrier protein
MGTVTDKVFREVSLASALGDAKPEQKIADLGLDSLEFLDLIVALEKEFEIKLDAEEVVTCDTLADLVALIENKCA